MVCEFSAITIAPVEKLYRRYLLHILPAIARRTARNPEAYEYLAESIVDWPAQREPAGLIRTAGWSAVKWRDLSLGAVAVHVARSLTAHLAREACPDPDACQLRTGRGWAAEKPCPARSKLMAKNL